MHHLLYLPRRGILFLLFTLIAVEGLLAQTATNVTVRVMSANLNGNTQNYQPFALRIFQGLKPDVVAIQEFNYNSTNGLGNNTPAAFREMLDTAFGTNFVYARETNNYNIPNGIISRYPIIAAGEWDDSFVNDRGFAWAQIHLPGTNDLFAVSVHLYSSGTAADRDSEATTIKTQIQNNFPAGAWVIVAGDFNTTSRGEAAIGTFSSFLSDNPIPTDAVSGGDPDTNEPRNKPYDYVLPSFSFAPFLTNVNFASHSFTNGLVFDSRVYSPLTDVAPVLAADSGLAQHMAVLKDFAITYASTNASTSNAPSIVTQPQGQNVPPGSNATFSVTASGAPTLAYQWLFYSTNITGANASAYSRNNVQAGDAGPYAVIITNNYGSITSSAAFLSVTNPAPAITAPPQSQTIFAGQDATFNVTTSGTGLAFQWRFNGTNIPSATSSSFTRFSAQTNDAGPYTVVVTNSSGSVTSAPPAVLTVLLGTSTVIAQWNFNSPSPDGLPTTGTLNPFIGSGTASYVGGTAAAGSGEFGAGSAVDPNTADNSAWITSTYPAATANNKTAGVRFSVSTLGRQNIGVRWDERASNTGTKYARLQYSTNGTTFVDFPTGVTLSAASVFEPKTNILAGIPGVNNNANFAFRIVAEFESTAITNANANYLGAGGTYGTGGTLRFDMVTVSGTVIPSSNPVAAAALTASSFNANQFQFTVNGTAGSNYVVQVATNLVAPTWLSLQTNAAPFTFTDTNTFAAPLRFYRAIVAPGG
jgi:endonuclease/exonuclease/phosphatase family metal-dependent hydrolase